MAAKRFLDTNILLYAYDLDAPEKRAVAQDILTQAWTTPGSTAISVQVLQEFQVSFVRCGHSLQEAAVLIDDFCHWPVVDNTLELCRAGIALQARWQLSL